MQKNLEIRRGDKEQWNPTSTAWNFFFFFARIFLHTFRKILYNFFLCCLRISRIMNAKKSRNSTGTTRAMKSHFYSMDFFFLSREFFYIHSEIFLIIFCFCCVRISRIINAKKSRNSRGNTHAMETHFYTTYLAETLLAESFPV